MELKEDKNPHYPIFFRTDWKKKLEAIEADLRKGMPIKNAFIHQGVNPRTYDAWQRYLREDWENGFEDTPFLSFMKKVAMIYEEVHADLMGKAFELAHDGDSQMVIFLLKSVYGHTPTRKSEVEMSTKEDTTFNINIIDSKPRED